MRKLRSYTYDELQKYLTDPNVRHVAVEIFLTSIGGLTKIEALDKLEHYALLYNWNTPTKTAIIRGINDRFMDR